MMDAERDTSPVLHSSFFIHHYLIIIRFQTLCIIRYSQRVQQIFNIAFNNLIKVKIFEIAFQTVVCYPIFEGSYRF